MRKWKLVDCRCRLRKNYLVSFGVKFNYFRQFMQSFPYFMFRKKKNYSFSFDSLEGCM